MLTSDSEIRKVILKFTGIIFIFFIILMTFFYYLKNETIAFSPLKEKAEMLLSMNPNAEIVVGGDSVTESGINPIAFKKIKVLNLGYQGTGFVSFSKFITQSNMPNTIKRKKIYLFNFTVLNTNDSSLNTDRFINLIDGFIDNGIIYLLKNWKLKFFSNLISVIQCRYVECSYYDEKNVSEHVSVATKGYYPLEGSIDEKAEIGKKFELSYESFYKNYNGMGAITQRSLVHLKELLDQNYKFFIVFPPVWKKVKYNNSMGVKGEMVKKVFDSIRNLCIGYKNCHIIDFLSQENIFSTDESTKYFNDYVHLNSSGATIFSKLIESEILKSGEVHE